MSHSGRVESGSENHLVVAGGAAKSANDSIERKAVERVVAPPGRVYVTRKAAEAVRARMNAHQVQILDDVHRLGVASGRQIQRLHYSSSDGAKRQARLDVAQMVRWHVLDRLSRRVGGERAGSSSYTYALGVAGQRIVDPVRARYRRPWTPGASHLNHALAVSELFVSLRESEGSSQFRLAEFETEPACWRGVSRPDGGRLTLKPDAMAVLDIGDFEDRYFIEMDCATESGPRIADKARTYIRYMQSGREQAETDIFPYVRWVTSDVRRAEFLIDVLTRFDAEHWRLFMVATADRAPSLMASGGEPIKRKEV